MDPADHTSPIPDQTVVRFTGCDWARERIDAIQDGFGRLAQCEFGPLRDRPLSIEARLRAFPGLGIADVHFSAATVWRRPQHLVSDDLIFNVNLGGVRTQSQRGREVTVEEGQALVTAADEVCTTTFSDARFAVFCLPRKAVKDLVPDIDDRIARPTPRNVAAVRLLTIYGQALQALPSLATGEMRWAAASHVRDLVALSLGTTHDGAEIATAESVRAARLRAVKVDIEHNLARGDLSAATIAARHRLPLRYLQRLFEAEGTTCTAFIRELRLARVHRMLIDPHHRARPVSAIAFEAGFQHLSKFNRAFRARFGETPSDVRAHMQTEQ